MRQPRIKTERASAYPSFTRVVGREMLRKAVEKAHLVRLMRRQAGFTLGECRSVG